MATPSSREALSREIGARAALPAAALLVFACFAVLWLRGPHELYFGLLQAFAVEPFTFPFLDAHAVLSAAECQRQGIDVYAANPCDALGRTHVYSPFWLTITPRFLNTLDTPVCGLVLALLTILCLAALFRPGSPGELAVAALAVFSPTTVFALERANNDVAIFILLVAAGLLGAAPWWRRYLAYALFLFAGLLKYYPVVMLLLMSRERSRRLMLPAGCAVAVLIGFCLAYRGELGRALANIPKPSYFDDAFAAINLPFGIGLAIEPSPARTVLIAAVFALLLFGLAVRVCRSVALLGAAALDWTRLDMRYLAMASLVVPGCFFAGQNIAYRGILILLALPGLLHLRRSLPMPAQRRWLATMLAAALFLLWVKLLHQIAAQDLAAVTGALLWPALWLLREAVWWWFVAGLLALAVLCLRQQPLFRELQGWRRGVPAASAAS